MSTFIADNVGNILTWHYDDVIMTMLASQITSLTVVYSIVYSGVNQRKHQSSASLAFVREIHRGPVNFPHKWPVTRKMFPFDDVIMIYFWNGIYICMQGYRIGLPWDIRDIPKWGMHSNTLGWFQAAWCRIWRHKGMGCWRHKDPDVSSASNIPGLEQPKLVEEWFEKYIRSNFTVRLDTFYLIRSGYDVSGSIYL